MTIPGTIPGARPRVLVTRPSADAIPLAGELQRRGFDVLLQPLLRIELGDDPLPELGGVQALLFTSANGVRAFARCSELRTLPVFAVGDATAAAAKAERFLSVASAGGDVADLARLVQSRLDPAGGKLLHAAGSAVAGDLAGALSAVGFAIERRQLYDARPAESFDPSIRAALAEGAVDAATFFSPRSAASFVSLVRAAGLAEACRGITAFCLSNAVASAASQIAWRSIAVAPEPTQDSLLAILERELIETSKPAASADLLQTGDATAVVERFGGIRPMATKLGVPVTTVQGWKARGHIPENRFEAVRNAAAAHGVDLSSGGDSVDSAAAGAPAEPAEVSPGPEPSDTPAAAPAPPPAPMGGSGVAWAALILAVVALAGVASYRFWGPLVGPPPPGPAGLAERIETLEAAASDAPLRQRLQSAETRIETATREIARLRAAGAGDGRAAETVAADLRALRTSIDALGQQIAQADQRAAASERTVADTQAALRAVRDEVAALRRAAGAMEERVTALETRRPVTGERIAALAVSAGQLESALDNGQPYAAALDRLKALADGDPAVVAAVAALDAWARQGVPTTARLTQRFAEIAPRLTAPPTATAGDGWIEALRAKALSLVNMRPLGEAGEASPVTRAERALRQGDLAAAAGALDSVSGPAAEWQAAARSRLAADAAVAALRTRIVDLLAAESHQAATGPGGKRGTP
jgi:uroporphyrinogen-III synthase